MKLSVSAFRAQASAQRKILSSYQSQLNYGTCTSYPALGGFKLEDKPQVMVDTTGINSTKAPNANDKPQTLENPVAVKDSEMISKKENEEEKEEVEKSEEVTQTSDKSPGRSRSKSNQRWMKLRTTVQLSGAISSTTQKSKPQLKREDSFLKRFSTRQIPEAQETVDTGDETETLNESQTQSEINRRRRKRRKEMSKTVVNPDENFYFYWLMTVTVCVLYNLWTLIVRQSFPELQKAASGFWYSGDGFTDVVFVCDIIMQFRTGYLEQGLMVYDSKKLAYHYLKSRAFIFDLLSLLPLDFLQLNIGVNPILRFPRFLKIYRVYSYYYMVESRTVYPNLWRVVNLIHILLILAHWFGCFYYLLSEAEGFQGDWVYPYRPGDYATLTRKYLGSLYWSTLTLTTIGDLPTPETNAESRGRSKAMTTAGQSEGIPRRGHKSRLLQFNSNYGYVFTIISYLIGVFIFATIVGQVGNVITNRNANRLEFERLLDGAKTYMRHHKVPGGMKRRVLRWYDYSWSRGRIQGGGDINTALGLLPDKLKTELALHVNLSVLKKVTIFQECQPEFLHDLVLKMKAYIFTPGDLICRKGEVAREMFIIADGILDVISETGRVLTTMKAGDFFGEIGILNLDGLNKRTADVRSVGYSELFSLSREDVLTAMKDYPEAQEILQSLGRKRLMEAKNASRMFKVQAKQAKDHDSSGDSDSAGKRIVEKLRSDVKGLKNALRRSRRETRNKEAGEKALENSTGKTSNNRQSILRRMSHVQSSDEYEGNNDVEQSPIGAGLPLLQRLKLLKEKQEKERDEKEKTKLITPSESQRKKDYNTDSEVTGIGLPFTQKLKLLKQKEGKEPTALGSVVVSSTVRTQLTGMRFDKSIFKCKNISSVKETDEKIHERKVGEENCDSNLRKKESTESQRTRLKEKLKVVQSSQEKEKILPSTALQEEEINPNFIHTPETQMETKKCDYSVPKLVRNKFEVSKDAWKLLKYSSITCSKPDRQNKKEINKIVMKVPNRGTYLSKSDTVLEKQKSWEREEEKRSRSVSPSDILNTQRKNLQKQNASYTARERRRAKSVSPSSKAVREEKEKNGENSTDFENSSSSARKDFNEKSPGEKRRQMKKYNSISDLSPEYSGLPFVKKLKILNERQKLEELEKELLVRSVSLDAPERSATKRAGVLVRSQSEAYATEMKSAPNFQTDLETKWENGKSLPIYDDCFQPKSDYFKSRNTTNLENNDGSRQFSEGCLDSPESNETLERKHLKSILKKLSAEGSTSDEDLISNSSKVNSTSKKADNTEFKKLMRAPTLEGYAARHKKLTKSVTFDSEPLLSPPEIVLEQTPEEGKGKSLSPMSPTAILTLQLSNLSMIPIAAPKTTDTKGDEEKMKENKLDKETIELKTPVVKLTGSREAKHFEISEEENDQDKFLMPYVLQELLEKSFRVLSFNKNLDEDSFAEIKAGILRVLEEFLEEVNFKFKTQFSNLRTEVEKRDEIILQLYSRIQDLERNASFEDIQALCSEPERHSSKEKDTVDEELLLGPQKNEFLYQDPLKEHLNCLDNVVKYEERNPLEDKIYLLQSSDNARELARELESPLEVNSVEDLELAEVPTSFGSKDFKKKKMKFHLIRNFSLDETESEEISKSENSVREVIKSEDEEELIESRSKGSFINRMTKIQRTFSRSQGKTSDFVALDIDDSSNSSDTENFHNKDWEVQMLVQELEKEDREWKTEEEKYNSRKDLEHLDDVRNLQEEVDRLKAMVCDGDLTRLTGSELDILESIIEAKDQKISELEKSNSLDSNDKTKSQRKQQCNCALGSDSSLKKYGGRRKKPSLRQKIGQALSFDFHDIDSGKSQDRIKHRTSTLRKQKTISCSPQEHQNVYNLWHTSSRLKNKVLEDSGQTIRNLAFRSSTEKRAGSSLPILIPGCLSREKLNEVRTSLPIIAAKELRTNFSQILRSSERPSPSIGSYKDICKKSYFKQNQESAFDESKIMRKSIQKEIRNSSPTLSSELIRSNDCQGSSSLNNFIKSVGQKVKQVMAGEGNTVRSQVPTISQLCDERVKHVKLEVTENLEVGAHGEESEEVKSVDDDQSKFSDSSKKKSKTEPPDL